MTPTFLQHADALARHSYYEATATRPTADDPVLDGPLEADVCVIGAGFSGLSVALDCRAAGLSVVVLEAWRPGWGASGRNGGQVIGGFAKDAEIARQLGEDGARAAWKLSLDGVELVAERIARHGIDCDFTRGYLTLATKPRRVPELRAWMDSATRHWGHPSLSWLDTDAIRARVASRLYLAGVHDPLSGHLHPLRYCLGLAAAARREGALLFAHSAVTEVVRGTRPLVRTRAGQVRCRFVVSCANAGPGGFLPAPIEARIAPVPSYLIATEPLGQARADALIARREAACDNNVFLDYFRLSADHRMLFGGRASSAGAAPAELSEAIRRHMIEVFRSLPTRASTTPGADSSTSRAIAPPTSARSIRTTSTCRATAATAWRWPASPGARWRARSRVSARCSSRSRGCGTGAFRAAPPGGRQRSNSECATTSCSSASERRPPRGHAAVGAPDRQCAPPASTGAAERCGLVIQISGMIAMKIRAEM